MLKPFVFLVAALVVLPLPWANAQTPEAEPLWVRGGEYRLKASVYRSNEADEQPTLVVVLHGDAPFNNPGYQDIFAEKVAEAGRNVVAVGLLRPGYTDPQGNTSDGERGEANGDNWNVRNTGAIAEAIGRLRQRYHSQRVIIVGHSGGAAIAANILGRHSELIDAALLVSCPCDAEAWRENMFALTGNPTFQGEVDTLSPIEQLEGMSDRIEVLMLVGDQDEVAPPLLSERYQAAAVERGKRVRLIQLAGKGHEILLDPSVLVELSAMLQ